MRRRILVLVVGMTALVVLAFAVPLAILIHNDAYNEGLDGLRKETGDIALLLREENSTKTQAQIRTKLAGLDSARMASVQLPSGDTVGRTPPGGLNDAPAAPGSYGGPSLGRGPRVDSERGGGAADIRVDAFRDGQLAQLRVPAYRAGLSLRTPGRADPVVGYTVRVYADDNTLRAGQTSPLLLLGGGAILLLVLGVVAGEVLTRRIVRPLVLTATTAQQLSTGDTAARAPTSGPAEVAAVGHALNRWPIASFSSSPRNARHGRPLVPLTHADDRVATGRRGSARPGRGRADRGARHHLGADADRDHPRGPASAARGADALGRRSRRRSRPGRVLVRADRGSGADGDGDAAARSAAGARRVRRSRRRHCALLENVPACRPMPRSGGAATAGRAASGSTSPGAAPRPRVAR